MKAMLSGRIGYTGMNRRGYMRNGYGTEQQPGQERHSQLPGRWRKGKPERGFGQRTCLHASEPDTSCVHRWQAQPSSRRKSATTSATNLKNERIFSSEFSYLYRNAWLSANVSGYYSRLENVTEWQNFYNDDENSFTYVSMTGLKKEYYGVEVGAKFKLTSWLDLKTLGRYERGEEHQQCKRRIHALKEC